MPPVLIRIFGVHNIESVPAEWDRRCIGRKYPQKSMSGVHTLRILLQNFGTLHERLVSSLVFKKLLLETFREESMYLVEDSSPRKKNSTVFVSCAANLKLIDIDPFCHFWVKMFRDACCLLLWSNVKI